MVSRPGDGLGEVGAGDWPSLSTKGATMGTDNRQKVEQHMKAWSSGDVDGIVACFTEDCVFEDLGLQATFEGHAALREFAAAVYAAAPDFHWTPNRMFAEGNQACTEWRFTLTQTGDF